MSTTSTIRIIKNSGTIAGVTIVSAWIGGILYSYYSTRKYKYANEFDTFFFSLEGLRNSFFISGAVGFVTSCALHSW